MPKNPVDPDSIPEVKEYLEAKEMLDAFKEANSQTFETFRLLVEEVNIKRQAADTVVRARRVSCADWDWFQSSTTYDPEKLFEHLGRDEFLRVGGKIQTQTHYAIDKAKIEATITRGELPQEVVDEVKKVSPKYHAPKDISL